MKKALLSGAIAQRIGRFEMADKGTLFLDEVGDIPPALAAQTAARTPGTKSSSDWADTHTRQVDVRLVAATNRDLTDMMKQGDFRTDLYYRLNVFPIRIPPLRRRSVTIV